jgi:hypothetical protein
MLLLTIICIPLYHCRRAVSVGNRPTGRMVSDRLEDDSGDGREEDRREEEEDEDVLVDFSSSGDAATDNEEEEGMVVEGEDLLFLSLHFC